MSSQIPFTPITPEALARLTQDEEMAFRAATMTVAQDQKPSLEVIATLVLTVQRLIGEPAPKPASLGATVTAAPDRALAEAIATTAFGIACETDGEANTTGGQHWWDWATGIVLLAIGQHARIVPKEPADGRPCSRCDGCGQLADTDDREPWTAWTSLPLKSSAALLLGQVKPIPCDVCGGTGRRAAAAEETRPGDQQLPVPNDGPSMHDEVISDLDCWPETDETLAAIRELLEERKRVGLERYKSLLQAGNGRDARRDLLEELADAVAYARQLQVERGQDSGAGEIFEAYEHIAFALAHAVQIPETGRG